MCHYTGFLLVFLLLRGNSEWNLSGKITVDVRCDQRIN